MEWGLGLEIDGVYFASFRPSIQSLFISIFPTECPRRRCRYSLCVSGVGLLGYRSPLCWLALYSF